MDDLKTAQSLNEQLLAQGINPQSLRDVECPKCQHVLFDETLRLKKISALESPNGKLMILPIPVFVCRSCGNQLEAKDA